MYFLASFDFIPVSVSCSSVDCGKEGGGQEIRENIQQEGRACRHIRMTKPAERPGLRKDEVGQTVLRRVPLLARTVGVVLCIVVFQVKGP